MGAFDHAGSAARRPGRRTAARPPTSRPRDRCEPLRPLTADGPAPVLLPPDAAPRRARPGRRLVRVPLRGDLPGGARDPPPRRPRPPLRRARARARRGEPPERRGQSIAAAALPLDERLLPRHRLRVHPGAARPPPTAHADPGAPDARALRGPRLHAPRDGHGLAREPAPVSRTPPGHRVARHPRHPRGARPRPAGARASRAGPLGPRASAPGRSDHGWRGLRPRLRLSARRPAGRAGGGVGRAEDVGGQRRGVDRGIGARGHARPRPRVPRRARRRLPLLPRRRVLRPRGSEDPGRRSASPSPRRRGLRPRPPSRCRRRRRATQDAAASSAQPPITSYTAPLGRRWLR